MNDTFASQSCFEGAKQVLQQLRRKQGKIQTGIQQGLTSYDISLSGIADEEKGCIIAAIINTVLRHLAGQNVQDTALAQNTHIEVSRENKDAFMSFTAADMDTINNFIANLPPPISLNRTIDKLREYFLDAHHWQKRLDPAKNAFTRTMGHDNGEMMAMLLEAYDISLIVDESGQHRSNRDEDLQAPDVDLQLAAQN